MISVIIPFKDRIEFLEPALSSLKNQSKFDFEVILVDDHSNDKTKNSVKKLVKGIDLFHLIHQDKDKKGACAARNLGAQKANYNYLVFMDSDDLVSKDFIEKRIIEITKQDLDMWIYPVLLFKSSPGDMTVLWNHFNGSDDLNRFLNTDTVWHTTSPVWKRSFFIKIGGFDEKLISWQDWEIHVRSIIKSADYQKFEIQPDIFYRKHSEESISKKNQSVNFFNNQVYLLGKVFHLMDEYDELNTKTKTLLAKLAFTFYRSAKEFPKESIKFLDFIEEKDLISSMKFATWKWRFRNQNVFTKIYDKCIYIQNKNHFLDTKTSFLNSELENSLSVKEFN